MAFLSDWKESRASTPTQMPTFSASDEANGANVNGRSPHQPSSPHLLAPAAPASNLPLPSGTLKLRRRNTYIVATETETKADDDGDEAMDSLVTTSLHQYQEQETMTTSESNSMSPSCTRAVFLHKETSAGSVGAAGFPTALPLPLPKLPFSPVGARPIDTEE